MLKSNNTTDNKTTAVPVVQYKAKPKTKGISLLNRPKHCPLPLKTQEKLWLTKCSQYETSGKSPAESQEQG